jgi:hypothetical protein
MLPFGGRLLQQRYVTMNSLWIQDEPSVSNWVVNEDGSVTIKKASIVPSSARGGVQAVPAGEYIRKEDCNISDWLASFRTNSEKHAVYLSRPSSVYSYGILLERVYKSRFHSRPKKFIKIGIFSDRTSEYTAQQPINAAPPVIEDVNWLVI